jgi:hypothetical protein
LSPPARRLLWIFLTGALAQAACSRGPSAQTLAQPVEARSEVACVDAWLREQDLDRYGSALGTVYPGGTPLFNEMTGAAVERLAYVYGKHPEARACEKNDGSQDSGPRRKTDF